MENVDDELDDYDVVDLDAAVFVETNCGLSEPVMPTVPLIDYLQFL